MEQQPINHTTESYNVTQNGNSNGIAIATLICGIASIVLFGYGVGLIPAIVALGLSRKYHKQVKAENKLIKFSVILAVIGIIASIIGMIVAILFIKGVIG